MSPSTPRRIGTITRGTTATNRLRRADRWLLHTQCSFLRSVSEPLCIDLGFGHSPATTAEWHERLAKHVRTDVSVVGVEIDLERVMAAQSATRPGLAFIHGGFEIPIGERRAHVVRAFNVLRQYSESEVATAWAHMGKVVADRGILIDGTCDEIGRLASWICLQKTAEDLTPTTLTLSAQISTLEMPSRFATRLPKLLIHHNVPGAAIHRFLNEFDTAWVTHAGLSVFSDRQRFVAAVQQLRTAGWPIHDDASRWRLGEVTVDWSAISN